MGDLFHPQFKDYNLGSLFQKHQYQEMVLSAFTSFQNSFENNLLPFGLLYEIQKVPVQLQNCDQSLVLVDEKSHLGSHLTINEFQNHDSTKFPDA